MHNTKGKLRTLTDNFKKISTVVGTGILPNGEEFPETVYYPKPCSAQCNRTTRPSRLDLADELNRQFNLFRELFFVSIAHFLVLFIQPPHRHLSAILTTYLPFQWTPLRGAIVFEVRNICKVHITVYAQLLAMACGSGKMGERGRMGRGMALGVFGLGEGGRGMVYGRRHTF